MTDFPITAMVGYEDATVALSAMLCSPDLHSVLIAGGSGTGKSIAARASHQLSGSRRIVNLPATSDQGQVFGTLDLEEAIRSGKEERTDSVLSRADGNILVIDDANLMRQSLLLSILEAAEEGMAVPETSSPYSVDLKVVCTMNPEEGDIDPHVLDRFDMCVFIEPIMDEGMRKEVARRRLAFDKAPDSLDESFLTELKSIRDKVSRADVSKVTVASDYPGFISEICGEMHVEGHRGDIAVLNTACALAALDSRSSAGMRDLSKAVKLCLQHRRRDPPENQPEPPQPQESEEDQNDDPPQNEEEDRQDGENESNSSEPRSAEENSDADEDEKPESQEDKVFDIGKQFEVRDYIPEPVSKKIKSRTGRRNESISDDGTGHTVGYMIPRERIKSLALSASIIAAAPKQPFRKHEDLAVVLKVDDLRENVRMRRRSTDIVFVVDGSGSMGAHQRMIAVKGAVLSLLNDAYRRRDRVGMAVFRGQSAEEYLPMTRSVLTAYRRLKEMPTGGKTPLTKGLTKGIEMLRQSRDQSTEPVMVVLTDGRGNSKEDSEDNIRKIAGILSSEGIRTIVIDTETGLLRFDRTIVLASMLDADYIKLEELSGRNLRSSLDSLL